MPLACTPRTIWQGDTDVLHHPLVLMVQDVAVQHKVTNVALITGADDQRILARRIAGGHKVLYP